MSAAVAPLFSYVEPDTTSDLPHATWHEAWRPVLRSFAEASLTMPTPRRVSFERIPFRVQARLRWLKLRGKRAPSYTSTWDLSPTAVADPGLRRELNDFAQAMYAYELPPGGAVILTGMLDGPHGDSVLPLFAWLHGAIIELAGHRSSAIAPPTGSTGAPDGSFEPHSDMWIPGLLMNILNDVVPGQGIPTLLPMEDLWGIAAEAGVPDEIIVRMKEARVEAGECDYFEQFNGLLYLDHPWTESVKAALYAAAQEVELQRGQGYFVNDREWLHGRTRLDPGALSPERKEHRLYRFVYNNRRMDIEAGERRIDWASVGRTAASCKS